SHSTRGVQRHTHPILFCVFPFTMPFTTDIYTLSLHDALPILIPIMRDAHHEHRHRGRRRLGHRDGSGERLGSRDRRSADPGSQADRKSTRLNSSHRTSSYAVFCLKKKKTEIFQRDVYGTNVPY